MTPGYHGRYLRVDASTGEATTVPLSDDVLCRFVGGVGLGTWIVERETVVRISNPSCEGDRTDWKSVPRDGGGLDPLSPSAPIAFVFSPLVGSPLTTSAKFAVVAKSPLTNRLNDSLSSSAFAISGKRTGNDAIVVVGRAERPSVLVVEPDGVRLKPADDLWGATIPATEAALRERLPPGFRPAVIGPAGERLVRFATVSHDGRHAGRGGHGAVLGSKNLKAIAVRGDRIAPVADPERLVAYARDLSERSFGPATAKYRELGTVANLLVLNRLGALPSRNFTASTFDAAVDLAPETIAAARERTRESCAACTIGCEHVYARPGRKGDGVRMEYENLYALGPLCGVSDPDVVLEASALCDDLGLDTISAGGTIAFAMDCTERGLLDGDLRFGDGPGLLDALRSIGERSGLGDRLAEGSRRLAEEIGGEAVDLAMHVKGLEFPGYEPRALPTMALGFAVGSRGADHNRSGAYQADFAPDADPDAAPDVVARAAIETENEAALMDSLILCKFLRGVFDDKVAAMAEMLGLVTGWDVTADELTATAGRIVTARKRYNVGQGWTPAEDTLPARLLDTPLPDGPRAGTVLGRERLEALVRAYNVARGWSPEGVPG